MFQCLSSPPAIPWTARHSKLSEPKRNQLLPSWFIWRAASSVGMAMDPEELVTLTDHGTMKLRLFFLRAMILPAKERKRAKIVREGEPAILIFKQIRNLGAKWDERRGSSPRGQRRFRSRGNRLKSRSIAR